MIHGRRQWLKATLAMALGLGASVRAEEASAGLGAARTLKFFRDSQGTSKFVLTRYQGNDLLYSHDYQFLSYFTTITDQDLQAMQEMVARSTEPIAQSCINFCQQTDLKAELARLEAFPKQSRPGSVFMESRGQSTDDRHASIDRFGEILLPQRQAPTLAPLFAEGDVVLLGETHDQASTHRFLRDSLALMYAQGFRTFGCEFVCADDQAFLDQYQPEQRPLLLKKLLWKNPLLYADLIEHLIALGIRPLALGQAERTLPLDGGFITENRNFQLAHHVMRFLQENPRKKLVVLIGTNHAGYSHNTFEGLRFLTRTHPVPDIPTLINRFLPQRRVVTAMFESNRPTPAPIANFAASFTWRYIRTELIRRGVTGESFMIPIPKVLEDRILTSWERRFDYYFYLPPVV